MRNRNNYKRKTSLIDSWGNVSLGSTIVLANALRNMRRLLLALIIALVLVCSASAVTRTAFVDPAIDRALKSESQVKVIITLSPEAKWNSLMPESRQQKILAQENKLISKLPDSKVFMGARRDGEILNKLGNTPIIIARLNKKAISAFSKMKGIESIHLSKQLQIELLASMPAINGDAVWAQSVLGTSVTGAGQSVCIIDTGVDAAHTMLAGKVVAQKCYCGAGGPCCQGALTSDNATDDHGHGTHVAGIAAGNDATLKGVAKDASIVAVKVCSASGSCDYADIAAAIDYCVGVAPLYNVSVISMSLGDGSSYATQADCPTELDGSISAATGLNIAVTVASGNSGSTTGISYPACSPTATSVGATSHAGTSIMMFGNRGPLLDVVAPGQIIFSAMMGGGYTLMTGTSMSAPHVAGVAALLAQHAKLKGIPFKPALIEEFMENASRNISGFRQVDALSALVKQATDITHNSTNKSLASGTSAVLYRQILNVSRVEPCLNLTFNNVTMNELPSCAAYYNHSATVRLFKLPFASAKPLLNGAACSALDCQNISYVGGTLQFDVRYFGSYSAKDSLSLRVNDSTDFESRFVGEQVLFMANFSSPSGPANTTDGACVISVLGASPVPMAHVSPFYQHNEFFGTAITGIYNVTCGSSDETLNAVDTFTISDDVSAPVVTLISPASGSVSPAAVSFVYSVADNTSINSCSLMLNGVVSGTALSVPRNIPNSFNLSLANGPYSWNVSCSDAWQSATSATWTTTVNDSCTIEGSGYVEMFSTYGCLTLGKTDTYMPRQCVSYKEMWWNGMKWVERPGTLCDNAITDYTCNPGGGTPILKRDRRCSGACTPRSGAGLRPVANTSNCTAMGGWSPDCFSYWTGESWDGKCDDSLSDYTCGTVGKSKVVQLLRQDAICA